MYVEGIYYIQGNNNSKIIYMPPKIVEARGQWNKLFKVLKENSLNSGFYLQKESPK